MASGRFALVLIAVAAFQLAAVFSRITTWPQNEYNVDYPKRISGSKMWCYRRQLAIRTETKQYETCTDYPCWADEGRLCRNCSVEMRNVKKRVYVRANERPFSQPMASEYQNISSPGYPGNYPSNVECVWLFKAPSKRQRHLTVEFHDLNIVEGCDDHVRVRFISRRKSPQKTKSTSGDPIRRRIFETMLCGSAKPVTYKNTRLAHLVEIVFKADSIHSSRGFRATFRGFGKTTTRDVIFDPDDIHTVPINHGMMCSAFPSLKTGIINQSVTLFKVSTGRALSRNVTRFTSTYSHLINATRLYYETYSNGSCTIRDPILQEIVANVQNVTWPATLWTTVSESPTVQDKTEVPKPTTVAVEAV